jgi:hypothetical protein
MAGFLGFDPFGSIVCVGITTTFGGSILSIYYHFLFFEAVIGGRPLSPYGVTFLI